MCVAEHVGELCFVCNRAASVAYMGGRGAGRGQFSCCFWPVITLVLMLGLTQGPYLVAGTSLSQDGFQHKGFWEVGRMY